MTEERRRSAADLQQRFTRESADSVQDLAKNGGGVFTVVVTFFRSPAGGVNVEASGAGGGPPGFASVVRQTLHVAADNVADMIEHAEAEPGLPVNVATPPRRYKLTREEGPNG